MMNHPILLMAAITLVESAASAQTIEHYQLKRDVLKVELTATAPVVRVQCTAQRVDSPTEATAVWDPDERRGRARYLLLARGALNARYTLHCASDRLEVKLSDANGTSSSEFHHYVFTKTACADAPSAAGAGVASAPTDPICMKGKLTAATGAPTSGAAEVNVRLVSVLPDTEKKEVLSKRDDVVPTTRLRSLDPVTPLISDALTALAAVAIDRAKTAGKEHARQLLLDTLCDRLTIELLRKAEGSAIARALDELGNGAADSPLLANTCKVISSVRLDELAASGGVLWKALAADAVTLALAIVEQTLEGVKTDPAAISVRHPAGTGEVAAQQEAIRARVRSEVLKRESIASTAKLGLSLTNVIGYTRKSALDALGGNTATTERDVQSLILELGQLGYGPSDVDGWRCGLEVGFAVLHECMRNGECSADSVIRLLSEEKNASGIGDKTSCDATLALQRWPELPGLLSRAVDVLRPPPGTPSRTTAVTALQLVLDVLDHALELTYTDHVDADHRLAQKVGAVAGYAAQEQDQFLALPASCTELTTHMQDLENIKHEVTTTSPEMLEQALRPFQAVFNVDIGRDLDVEERKCVAALKDGSLYASTWEHLERISLLAQVRRNASHTQFAKAMVGAIRAFLDMLVREDGTLAVAEIASTLSGAVDESCAVYTALHDEDECPVPVTSKNIERAFSVIGALVSYGTSYRSADASSDGDDANLAELRADERRRAMDSLIEALTDRSNRRHDWVGSFGSAVGIAASWVGLRDSGGDDHASFNQVPLRLDTGLSLQYLPDGWSPGAHIQLTLLDLAQYAAIRDDAAGNADNADADPGTAVLLGANAGVLFGDPSVPVLVSLFGGYAPWLRFDADQGQGAYVFGASVGVYVPFVDFN